MHDTTLLQLIEDDIAPMQELLDLLQKEAVALHGRDMAPLENILARKQSLIVLLEQQGLRRNNLLASLGLSPDRAGVEAVAAQSPNGELLLQQLDVISQLMQACQQLNETNGRIIQVQQHVTNNQIRILMGGDSPSLYDSRGSTSPLAKPRALSQV
ncbi:flagellar protein FlgN [Pseudomonas plecoglossicida]|jgi:flagella synthesis protein FlgN|uniref:Flagellar protein FlgN n=5 Tax=Gammaproteobacteria TaxID=1236 RepID=A0ABX4TX94_PSEDL|nr:MULTISPECIES: flagellar protein FlgN [Pseudomonas]TXI07317.1 MAG: flagellar protein FlgN [Pseudomonas monteilii]GJB78947.1 flagellar synthesis chaperone protein FlgN [Aeromonas caviae]AGA74668.1 FlgN family protein [Pseudomonas putida HB3267]KPM65395.1 flagellar biosynthesis protein FlgN [Pseudomonas putida]MCE0753795.1 flagellar protein FlgN [Pseudomonas asiatica]